MSNARRGVFSDCGAFRVSFVLAQISPIGKIEQNIRMRVSFLLHLIIARPDEPEESDLFYFGGRLGIIVVSASASRILAEELLSPINLRTI